MVLLATVCLVLLQLLSSQAVSYRPILTVQRLASTKNSLSGNSGPVVGIKLDSRQTAKYYPVPLNQKKRNPTSGKVTASYKYTASKPTYNPPATYEATASKPTYNPPATYESPSIEPKYNSPVTYEVPAPQPTYTPPATYEASAPKPTYIPPATYEAPASKPTYTPPATYEAPASKPIYTPPATYEASASKPIYTPPATYEAPASKPIYNPPATYEAPASKPTYTPPATYEAPAPKPTYTPPATYEAPAPKPTYTPPAKASVVTAADRPGYDVEDTADYCRPVTASSIKRTSVQPRTDFYFKTVNGQSFLASGEVNTDEKFVAIYSRDGTLAQHGYDESITVADFQDATQIRQIFVVYRQGSSVCFVADISTCYQDFSFWSSLVSNFIHNRTVNLPYTQPLVYTVNREYNLGDFPPARNNIYTFCDSVERIFGITPSSDEQTDTRTTVLTKSGSVEIRVPSSFYWE